MNWPIRRPAVPRTCRSLNVGLVEKELIRTHGNISAAAKVLEVPSIDLRKYVWSTPRLADAVYEQIELALDEAEAVIRQGLRSEQLSQRLQSATFLLQYSQAAKRRGWGSGGTLPAGSDEHVITLRWLEPGEAPGATSSSSR
jgi:hypothetical protein